MSHKDIDDSSDDKSHDNDSVDGSDGSSGARQSGSDDGGSA